ncbi:MAG: AAA family ATPase [Candidatus Peregrinibacteria bacterium]
MALGVDVDVCTTAELSTITTEEIDRRKNTVLEKIVGFPLSCHETHETLKGLHIVFLVSRVPGAEGKTLYKNAMGILQRHFGGDPNACLITQLLRFPGTPHLKNPKQPFQCRTLIDRLDDTPAHNLHDFMDVLQAKVIPLLPLTAPSATASPVAVTNREEPGILEGTRNARLTSIAGTLHRQGLSSAALHKALCAINMGDCRPPLKESEVSSIARSISRYPNILDSRFPLYTNRENREIGHSTFALQSIGDFLAEPEEKLNWIVQDLLPAGGFSLCAAKPKVGKSTEARTLLRCVARGEPYLGRATTQGKVLYLAFEEKRGEVRRKFAQMGLSSEDSIRLYVGSSLDGGLEALGKAIAEEKPILVVVDPLFLLLPVKDINDYAELLKRLDPLRSLARDNGCHILTTHHLNKMGGSSGDGVLGSTAIFGTVDTLILMRKREDGSRIIQTSQRYGTDLPETVLSLDRETGQTAPLGDLETIQTKDAEQEVRDALGDDEMNETQIREKAGGNTRVISAAIRNLLTSGELTRTGEGKRGNPFRYRKENVPPANVLPF